MDSSQTKSLVITLRSEYDVSRLFLQARLILVADLPLRAFVA